MTLRPASDLLSRPISWLWPGRLALGKLAILDGDPGLGKSFVTLDLCARLSKGQPFPDGSSPTEPAASLILNGEDGEEDTIRPRLQALDADLERVFVLHRAVAESGEPFRLPAHRDLLQAAVKRTNARLIVIDPVVAFLEPSIAVNNDASVRRALYPLAQLAELHSAAIILVRHLNKTHGRHALYRGGGSIGLIGACRSGWLIAPDPLSPGSPRRILAQTKNNLAPPQTSLAFEIQSAAGAPTLTWLGPAEWTADQLLGQPSAAESAAFAGSPRHQAKEFLESCLSAGPRTSREIWPLVQDRGLSERTIERAKRDLEIRSVQVWANGQHLSYWLLPSQQLPEGNQPDPNLDLEPWLAPLRAQYPPATPLDDL